MEGFSTRLRELRRERSLRQKDLASALGLAQTTIANYEQNTRFPDEEILKKIADYFNTSLDFLLGVSEVPGRRADERESEPPAALSPLARAYLESLLAGDKQRAIRLILDERAKGFGPQAIYTQVLEPVLEEVGRRWETAQADVYQEHFVSAATIELMTLVMQGAVPQVDHRGTVLSVVGAGERHEIGLRMATDFLELAGWKVVYLGTNLPHRDVIKAVEEYRADLLGVSVTLQYNLNGAANLIASLRAAPTCRSLRILVGGRAFRADREVWRRVGADGFAPSAAEAVEAAGHLAGR